MRNLAPKSGTKPQDPFTLQAWQSAESPAEAVSADSHESPPTDDAISSPYGQENDADIQPEEVDAIMTLEREVRHTCFNSSCSP